MENEQWDWDFQEFVSGRYSCALFGVINCCFLKVSLVGPADTDEGQSLGHGHVSSRASCHNWMCDVPTDRTRTPPTPTHLTYTIDLQSLGAMGVQDASPAPGRGVLVAHNTNITRAYGQQHTDHPQINGRRRQPPPASHTVGITSPAMPGPTRKRKAPAVDVSAHPVIDLTADSPPPSETPKPKRRRADGDANEPLPNNATVKGKQCQPDDEGKEKPNKKAKKDGEKRLRRWRAHAPSAYRDVRERALTQRMFVLDRQRSESDPEAPSETISLAGTTGNIYTITIDKLPTCDCPHARKGNQCKHIVYVLSRVLRAPAELEYQLAFTSPDLKDIFARAPPLPSETARNDDTDGNRKPVEGECPICCDEFEPESSETIVYCKAACGNNIHKDCFCQWAATKTGQAVTCPFCRSPWQDDEDQLKQVAKNGRKNADGYVNVASQLGLSGRRDYSTYNSYWVRGLARSGEVAWDEDGVMDHEY
jgi:hypothetical protein